MPLPAIREKRQIQSSARVSPDVLQTILLDEISGRLEDLTDIMDSLRDLIAREKFQGRVDVITLAATSTAACLDVLDRWHKSPLATAYLTNDGPNSVLIGINNPFPWMTIKSSETRTIDHTKAREKIERIFYKCASGETASVRVEGEY